MESFAKNTKGDTLSSLLRETHAQNLATYKRILLGTPIATTTTESDPFWDVVVITAGDTEQRLVYGCRIDQALDHGRIPSQAK